MPVKEGDDATRAWRSLTALMHTAITDRSHVHEYLTIAITDRPCARVDLA